MVHVAHLFGETLTPVGWLDCHRYTLCLCLGLLDSLQTHGQNKANGPRKYFLPSASKHPQSMLLYARWWLPLQGSLWK